MSPLPRTMNLPSSRPPNPAQMSNDGTVRQKPRLVSKCPLVTRCGLHDRLLSVGQLGAKQWSRVDQPTSLRRTTALNVVEPEGHQVGQMLIDRLARNARLDAVDREV